jgi:signal transduction histidine kinase
VSAPAAPARPAIAAAPAGLRRIPSGMSPLRRALVALGVAGFAWGLAFLALGIASEHPVEPVGMTLLHLAVGWAFLYIGLFVWARRPDNRMGVLLATVGFVWFLPGLLNANSAVFVTAGLLLQNISLPVAFSLVAFPTGVIGRRLDRAVLACTWVWATAGTLVVTLLGPTDPSTGRPENLLALTDSQAVKDAAYTAFAVWGALLAVGLVAAVVVRWRRSTAPERRELAPVMTTGIAAATAWAVLVLVEAAGVNGDVLLALEVVGLTFVGLLAFAFLAGLARARVVAGRAVSRVIARLSRPVAATELRAVLAEALQDPSLDLVFPLPGRQEHVDADGRIVALPGPGSGRSLTPVARDGRPLAVIVHDAALDREGGVVESAGAAAALALENARLQAELRAQVAEVSASRARIITAGDEERRRLERDLHDGAQQRLVSLALRLRMARSRVEDDAPAAPLIDGAMEELEAALSELRELARGIHPAVLTERGLAPALRGLASRATLPVELGEVDEERLPAPVEAAAYFLVSEALANVAKYSHASHAAVSVRHRDGVAVVEVVDDGIGGADPGRGSGLSGLSDRVSALGGTFAVESRAGRGTTVRAEIPCGS